MAIHAHGLPTGFTTSTEREAEVARAPDLSGRTDLRDLPFVTIDPNDAKDHDDAVYAHRTRMGPIPAAGSYGWPSPTFAHYVTSGSSLDRDARDKGNSTYFPDRVEPMLPHVLSSACARCRRAKPRHHGRAHDLRANGKNCGINSCAA